MKAIYVLFALWSVILVDKNVYGTDAPIVVCGQKPLVDLGIDVPVRAIYKHDRHRYLPRTMGRLLAGVDLQAVALGDSIVGNTFGPQYAATGYHTGTAWGVEPLAALYRSTIYAVVSVLGSTGAWYYRLPGNVQTYVLVAQPDLVLIGGISNRDDIDAIRDVIAQIRVASSNTEIILMTGAVDLQAVPTQSSLVLDENADTYEARLSKLADEVGAGFIDMRGSYNEFVIETNRSHPDLDQSYFQADPIHANDRGRAILREIITNFFRPAIGCEDRSPARQRILDPPTVTVTNVQSNSSQSAELPLDGSYMEPSTLAGDSLVAHVQGDIDDDGVTDDLALYASASRDTDRLLVSSNGSQSANTSMTLPMNVNGASSLHVADVNGDGWADVIVGTDSTNPYIYLYLNSKTAGQWFFDPIRISKGNASGCTEAIMTVDANKDGRLDLITANGCIPTSDEIDYYQMESDEISLDRLAPESYDVNMKILDLRPASVSSGGATSLIITGTDGGVRTTREMRFELAPSSNDIDESGGGYMSLEHVSVLLALLILRLCTRREMLTRREQSIDFSAGHR